MGVPGDATLALEGARAAGSPAIERVGITAPGVLLLSCGSPANTQNKTRRAMERARNRFISL